MDVMASSNPYAASSAAVAAPSTAAKQKTEFEPALILKLLQRRHPEVQFRNDAAIAAGELLRQFVLEAREKAAVEAECEAETKEVNDTSLLSMEDYDERGNDSDDGAGTNGRVEIRPDHIAKIAAELLLDW